MLSRFLVILLFVPLLIYVLIIGEKTFLIFNLTIIAMSMYEFYTILRKKGYIVYSKIGIFLGMLLPLLIYYKDNIENFLKTYGITDKKIVFEMGGFIVFSFMIISIMQIIQSKIKNSTNELTYTLFGIIYISFFLSHMILIRNLNYGKAILLFTFFSIWACDTFAYLVGRLIGGKIFKTKLSKDISPSKSIEGFLGGILGVFLIGFFYEYIYLGITQFFYYIGLADNVLRINNLISDNLIKLLLLSTLIAIFSVLGDLFESKFKREFGVKDSSKILLEHGGFLDRFDSSLFVLPLVYYFVKFLIL